jgi:hypothetical protein
VPDGAALSTALEALVRGRIPVSAATPAADTVMTEMAAAAIRGCSRAVLLVSMMPSSLSEQSGQHPRYAARHAAAVSVCYELYPPCRAA